MEEEGQKGEDFSYELVSGVSVSELEEKEFRKILEGVGGSSAKRGKDSGNVEKGIKKTKKVKENGGSSEKSRNGSLKNFFGKKDEKKNDSSGKKVKKNSSLFNFFKKTN